MSDDLILQSGSLRAADKRVGMILFLASEAMFFLALFAAFIVLRSAQPEMFASHARALSRPIAIAATIASIISAGAAIAAVKLLKPRSAFSKSLVFLSALACFTFVGCIDLEWRSLLSHHTIVIRAPRTSPKDPLRLLVIDASVESRVNDSRAFDGKIANAESGIDSFKTTAADVEKMQAFESVSSRSVDDADVVSDVSYGPWKSTFFAWFFLATGAHAIHVIGGMIAMLFWLWKAMTSDATDPALPIATTAFVSFCTIAWLAMFLLIYF